MSKSSATGTTASAATSGGSKSTTATAAAASTTSSASSAPPSPNYSKLLRTWFLSLTKHERSCMLVLEDAKTTHALLSMYGRKCEKGGDGYFYGAEHSSLDRISDSSGRHHHHHSHHGSSLLCTGGAESECSFCGGKANNGAAYDGDILSWLTDDISTKQRRTNARNRSSSGSTTNSANSKNKANSASASSSLLSGLNLADPFQCGASIFNTSSSSSLSSSSASSISSSYQPSQLLFSSKMNPLYHTQGDLRESELELERSVRLCDTRGYIDTLCVTSNLLLDGTRFVSLMDKISQNGFLSTPCYCTYDAKSKVWLWDVPAWFRKRNLFSLGAFLANKLEMVLWMRYWEHTGIDPRKVPSGKAYVAGGLVRERLSSKSPLAHFWTHLAQERREKMLTKLILLVEQYAHSLQHQYETITGQKDGVGTNDNTNVGDEGSVTETDQEDGDYDNDNLSLSAHSTPTHLSRRLRISSSSASASASASTSVSGENTAHTTRSHSLPRRHHSLGQQTDVMQQASTIGSGGASQPLTPSSTNSAPPAQSSASAMGLFRPSTATATTHATHSTHASTHSPWSSMQSSFNSSLTTSPSSSPSSYGVLLNSQPPTLALTAHQSSSFSQHATTSPLPVTPTLTHVHTHTHTHVHTTQLVAASSSAPSSSSLVTVASTALSPTPSSSSLLHLHRTSPSSHHHHHTQTPPPPSASPPLSSVSSAPSFLSPSSTSPLPSLFKSSWDRDRSVGPELVRDLMATAAATQVKSALHLEKHKHLLATYAAASPDSNLTKEQVEKLKEMDYDFTMTGLELLAHLLASMTHSQQQLQKNAAGGTGGQAMPRMARATTSTNQKSAGEWIASVAQMGSPAQQHVLQSSSSSSSASLSHSHAHILSSNQSNIVASTPPVQREQTINPIVARALAGIRNARNGIGSRNQAVDANEERLSRSHSASSSASASAVTSPSPLTFPSSFNASLTPSSAPLETSPQPPAVATNAAVNTTSSSSSSSSGLGLVVGMTMPQLLLYAEREAASKSIAVAAARIESLRTSWPSSSHVDDWAFIEHLFSSPLSRAHTNLDKFIRRIGLLLQACYAEQIGVDLIMGEEAEESTGSGGVSGTIREHTANKDSTLSSSSSSSSSSASKQAKKKKKQKQKLAAKKKFSSSGSAEKSATSSSTNENDDADENDADGGEGDEQDGEKTSTKDDVASSSTAASSLTTSTIHTVTPKVRPFSASASSSSSTHPTPLSIDTAALPVPVRAASADNPPTVTTASLHNTAGEFESPPPQSQTTLGRSQSSSLAMSSSSDATAESDEPWQRVSRGKGERTKSAAGTCGTMPHAMSLASSGTRSTPLLKPRAKDDNFTQASSAQQRMQQPPIRTPPPTLTRAQLLMTPRTAALHHASTLHHAANANTSTTASSTTNGGTPSSASPHFTSSLSFPAFGVRPTSWSAAAGSGSSAIQTRKSSSSTASAGSASGNQTPTLTASSSYSGSVSSGLSLSGGGANKPVRAKDDSFTHQDATRMMTANERRASVQSLTSSASVPRFDSLSPPAVSSSSASSSAPSSGTHAMSFSAAVSASVSPKNNPIPHQQQQHSTAQQQQQPQNQHGRNSSAPLNAAILSSAGGNGNGVAMSAPMTPPHKSQQQHQFPSPSMQQLQHQQSSSSGSASADARTLTPSRNSPLVKSLATLPSQQQQQQTQQQQQSPLLPTPPNLMQQMPPNLLLSNQQQQHSQQQMAMVQAAAAAQAQAAAAHSQAQSQSVASPYGRTNTLHLAKPVPIHQSSPSGLVPYAYSHTPSSVGLSFSSVPAHHYLTHGVHHAGGDKRTSANHPLNSYVHGTDDVTLQAWQMKHEGGSGNTNSAAAGNNQNAVPSGIDKAMLQRWQQQYMQQQYAHAQTAHIMQAHAALQQQQQQQAAQQQFHQQQQQQRMSRSSASPSSRPHPSSHQQQHQQLHSSQMHTIDNGSMHHAAQQYPTRPRSNSAGEESILLTQQQIQQMQQYQQAHQQQHYSHQQMPPRPPQLDLASASGQPSSSSSSASAGAPSSSTLALPPNRPVRCYSQPGAVLLHPNQSGLASPMSPTPSPIATIGVTLAHLQQAASSSGSEYDQNANANNGSESTLRAPASSNSNNLNPYGMNGTSSSLSAPPLANTSESNGTSVTTNTSNTRPTHHLPHNLPPAVLIPTSSPASLLNPVGAQSSSAEAARRQHTRGSSSNVASVTKLLQSHSSSDPSRRLPTSPPPVLPSTNLPSVSSLVAYHSSVQMAQSYQRKQGGQDTPWLNASNRQRFAFSTHTGQVSGHTTPVPLDMHGDESNEETQQQSGSDSRRSSLSSNSPLMPNFLVMPNLSPITTPRPRLNASIIQQHQQHHMNMMNGGGGNSNTSSHTASPTMTPSYSRTPSLSSARPFQVDPLPSASLTPSPPPSRQQQLLHGGLLPSSISPSSASAATAWSLRDSWRLHDEICVFSNYVSEVTTLRQPTLLKMIDIIRTCVQSLWEQAEVECYGSFVTGLCLPTSDLDLVLKGVTINTQQALIQLSALLRKQKDWLQSLNAISTAKVPVIKLLAYLDEEEIIVDISFDSSTCAQNTNAPPTIAEHNTASTTIPSSPSLGSSGGGGNANGASYNSATSLPPAPVHTGVASVELIRQYLSVFPSLRPLSLVLKQFLYERGLANTYTGGLNSYCLILMIVGFLQSRPYPYHAYQHAQTQLQAKAQTHVLDQLMTANQRSAQQQHHHHARTESHDSTESADSMTSLSSEGLTSPKRPSFSVGRPRESSIIVQAAVQRIEEKIQLEGATGQVAPLPSTPLSAGLNGMSGSLSGSGSRSGSFIQLPTFQLLPQSCATPPLRSTSSTPPSSSSLSPSCLTSPPTPAYGRAATTENLGVLLIEFLDFFGCHFDFQTMAIGVTMPPTSASGKGGLGSVSGSSSFSSASGHHGHQRSTDMNGSSSSINSISNLPNSNPQHVRDASYEAAPPSTAYGGVPPSPAQGGPPTLFPLQQFNYISLLPEYALPADWKLLKQQMAQLIGTNQPTPGHAWGHGVFYSLSGVSRVLVISDPFFPLLVNNIGKSVFAMWRIKQAFEEGHTRLAAKFAVHGAAPTLLARIIQKMQHPKKKLHHHQSQQLQQPHHSHHTSLSHDGPSSHSQSGSNSLHVSAHSTPNHSSHGGKEETHATFKGLTHIVLPKMALSIAMPPQHQQQQYDGSAQSTPRDR